MARRPRDYKAEYERRIAKGQAKGLTKAQARRGAIKYANQAPREHIRAGETTKAKYGLSPSQLSRVRKAARSETTDRMSYRDLPFPSIETAGRWAREQLDAREASFINGYGQFRDTKADSHYDRTKSTNRGWAAVNTLALPSFYTEGQIQAIQDHADTIFTDILRVVLKVRPFVA